ncbi:MAG: hypothetical protein AB7F96_15385 [Beijerinckiaceae bacterium]
MAEELRNSTSFPDERLIVLHVSKIATAGATKDKAVSSLRTARKKAEAAGIDLSVLDHVKGQIAKDILERTAFHNACIAYGKALSDPVYGRMSPVDIPTNADDKELTDRAYAYGIQAGKLGKSITENPYPMDTAMGQEWAKGHGDGQAVLTLAFKELDNPDNTDEGDESTGD